jgi:beta-ureidopropionase / N-carbamoyl-L-amino-acid hydrolase
VSHSVFQPAPKVTAVDLAKAVVDVMPTAESLFAELAEKTSDPPGVTRDSYGAGEQTAHEICAATAREMDLDVWTDDAGNLYMELEGADPQLPAWYVGSHLDSVLHGGNFDGAAGVVAGLTSIAAFRKLGVLPRRRIIVMGTRAEECSTWFVGHHKGHLGSRAALGLLEPSELESAVHVSSRRTLAQCMDDAGFRSARFRDASLAPYISPKAVHAYVELHIEQGPVLEHRGLPVGVVTAIRGCIRARSARTIGGYTHSGAVPHELRQDAVLATVEFASEVDKLWTEMREKGQDLVCTFGKFSTDPAHHSIVKVPGRVDFAFDFRSQDRRVLDYMQGVALELADTIGRRRNVRIELGDISVVTPATMDGALSESLREGCVELQIPYLDIPSGAGHDAADFFDAGIRAAMIFVRNGYGSHNPDEAMSLDDFASGTRLLTWLLSESRSTER